MCVLSIVINIEYYMYLYYTGGRPEILDKILSLPLYGGCDDSLSKWHKKTTLKA